MKTFLTLLLLLVSFVSYGQEDTTKTKQISSIINLKTNVEDTIGTFFLLNKTLKDDNGHSYKVKRVEINIKDGFITKCYLFTEEGVFFELTDKIFLLDFKRYVKNKALRTSDDACKIDMSNLIFYLPSIDNDSYFPSDTIIELTEKKQEISLTLNSNIYSFINVNVYSDFFAMLDRESNGLVQTELLSNINLNSYPINSSFYLFHYIEPKFQFSKFDSKYSSQLISDTVAPFKINRLKFNQLSFINLSLSLNLISIKYFNNTFDLLNIGFDYKFSDITVEKTSEKKEINSVGYSIETRGEILKYKNFGLRYSLQGYFQKIKSSIIDESNLVDPYLITEFSIFYYPKGKKDNMGFIRFRNFTGDFESGYYNTLQIGYSTNFNFK